LETVPEDQVCPLMRKEYDALVELGYFDSEEDDSIELLEGVLVAKDKEGDDHATTQRRLLRYIFDAVPATEAEIGAGNPIGATPTSEPEPDVALFPPAVPRYRRGHPTSATLLIEVSHTSLRRDLILKARIYAQGVVPDYWVVDLVHREVVVHRSPTPDGYAEVTRHREDALTPLHHPGLTVDLAALFAPITG